MRTVQSVLPWACFRRRLAFSYESRSPSTLSKQGHSSTKLGDAPLLKLLLLNSHRSQTQTRRPRLNSCAKVNTVLQFSFFYVDKVVPVGNVDPFTTFCTRSPRSPKNSLQPSSLKLTDSTIKVTLTQETSRPSVKQIRFYLLICKSVASVSWCVRYIKGAFM